MKRWKKSLSLILCFVMVLSLFPVSAFADDAEEEQMITE